MNPKFLIPLCATLVLAACGDRDNDQSGVYSSGPNGTGATSDPSGPAPGAGETATTPGGNAGDPSTTPPNTTSSPDAPTPAETAPSDPPPGGG